LLTIATIGIDAVALLACGATSPPQGKDEVGLELDQLRRQRGKPLEVAFGLAIFDRDGFAVDIAKRLKALQQRREGFMLR
jgi:hypothetical protein